MGFQALSPGNLPYMVVPKRHLRRITAACHNKNKRIRAFGPEMFVRLPYWPHKEGEILPVFESFELIDAQGVEAYRKFSASYAWDPKSV
jgi:hypothetical protein